MNTASILLFIAIGCIWLCNYSHAANTSPSTIYRSDIKLNLDGKLDEQVWQYATRVSINNVIEPHENIAASFNTEAYLYEDGESLYIGIRADDPNPNNIRAAYRERDAIQDDDHVSVIIDTFNSQRRAVVFSLNPLGVQADLIRDQTQLTEEDDSWDAIWQGAGSINNSGYTLEFKIPFRALRFPDIDGPLTWGIEFSRIYPRNNRMEIVSQHKSRGNNCYLCQIPKFSGFDDVTPHNDLLISPFVIASRNDQRSPLENEDRWNNGDIDVEGGANIRWGITQDVILNATINPDFSQVEADAPLLDVNEVFSLFFPEKRAFFLDGANNFKTTIFNLVHTRNIASPDLGAKLTGKNGRHLYGVMAANDDQTSFLLPSSQSSRVVTLTEFNGSSIHNIDSNVGIARYRTDLGERSNTGVLVTHRSADDYKNSLASVDGIYKWNASNRINYQYSYSDTDNPLALQTQYNLDQNQSGAAYQVHYAHSKRNYDITGGHMNFDEGFRSDLGFISRVDYKKSYFGGGYRWFGKPNANITRKGIRGDWDKTFDQSGQKLEEEIEIYFYLDGPMQLFSELGVVSRDTFWQNNMFDELFFILTNSVVPQANLRLNIDILHGQVVDFANTQEADSSEIKIGAEWRIGSHLSGELEYINEYLNAPAGQLFEVNQIDLRANMQFDLEHSVRIVLTYTDIERNSNLYINEVDETEKRFNTQIVYAYEPNPQTVAYAGYSDQGIADENNALQRNERSLFMKLSYAFQL